MPIDAVLLTHDHHADNLDDAGRELLDTIPLVITTTSGRARLSAPSVTGLSAWDSARLEGVGKEPLSVLATPCRHGPPLSRPITGEVIGFALTRVNDSRTAVWFSGDSVYYRGLGQVGRRLDIDVAVIHLGAVRFRSTGPFSYTLSARRAVKLLKQLRPRVTIPVHTDGWSHFSEGGAEAKRVFTRAPESVRAAVRWLDPGTPTRFQSQVSSGPTT
jgi:L-ascorbate metabolism protein UlaG (beta-lactamase superfamily)